MRETGTAIDAIHEAFREESPIAIPAPAIMEFARGVQRGIDKAVTGIEELRNWFEDFLDEETVAVLPFDDRAAIIAGELRARRPIPPQAPKRRKERGAEGRVAWTIDIQIATTAWVWGHDIVTPNRLDFEAIAEELARLEPDAPALGVLDPTF